MTSGMGCFVHPERQGVAQCKRCGKAMCGECSELYSGLGEQYVGLCKGCVLQAGIECSYHSSQQATEQCERNGCKKFICSSCYDNAWRSVDIGGNGVGKTYCHSCVGTWIVVRLKEWMERFKKEAKSNVILMSVFAVIGFIIGLVLGISTKDSGSIILYAWVGTGIGFGLRALLSLLYFAIFENFKPSLEKHGFFGGLKEWLGGVFLGGLFWAIVLCILGFITGPILPVYYILRRGSQLKKVDAMMLRASNLSDTLLNAHNGQLDSTKQAEIRQGASLFIETEQKMEKIDNLLLWILH